MWGREAINGEITMFVQENIVRNTQSGNSIGFLDLWVEQWRNGDGVLGWVRSLFFGKGTTRFLMNVEPGSPLVIRSANRVQIQSLQGRAWVTRQGDCQDYEVALGKIVSLDASKRLVINAMSGSARVSVTLS